MLISITLRVLICYSLSFYNVSLQPVCLFQKELMKLNGVSVLQETVDDRSTNHASHLWGTGFVLETSKAFRDTSINMNCHAAERCSTL